MRTRPIVDDVSFDDKATRAMGIAFDCTCSALADTGVERAVKEIVALRILEAAKAGEHNCDRLLDIALQELSAARATMQALGLNSQAASPRRRQASVTA